MADDNTVPYDPTLDPRVSPNAIGSGGYITPQQLQYLYAQGLMSNKPKPAKSWMEAIGNTVDAGVGQLLANRAMAQGQAAKAAYVREIENAAQPGAGNAGDSGAGGAPADPGATARDLQDTYAPILGNAGAAGLVGTFGHETGGTYSTTIRPKNGENSFGYAQWHDPQRQADEAAYAKKLGKSPYDPQVQSEFPMVEMGLWGDQSDPGYGKFAQAGAALQAARTPQQGTAAALMYERPQGYSDAHPENSAGYAHRLALATALMGRQPGNPQVASNGPMAYADSSSDGGGGMAAVRSGAGTPVSLNRAPSPPAAAPVAPRGPVTAQNASPMANLSPGAFARITANEVGAPQNVRDALVLGNTPQIQAGPFGSSVAYMPLQTQSPPRTVTMGATPIASTVGTDSVGTSSIQPVSPVGSPNAPTLDARSLEDLAKNAGPAQKVLQGRQAENSQLQADQKRLNDWTTDASNADIKLGQIESLRQLGKGVTSGLPAQLKTIAAQYGWPLDQEAGRLQLYRYIAGTLLPGDAGQGLREHVPLLSADEMSKGALTDYLESQWQHIKRRGMIATDPDLGNATQKNRMIQLLPPPQSYGAPAAPQGSPVIPPRLAVGPRGANVAGPGAPGAPGAPGQRPPGVPAEARQSPLDGHWYTGNKPGEYQRWD